MELQSLELMREAAQAACRAAGDKKGEDITLLDVTGISGSADYLVIITGRSRPHAKAVAQAVCAELDAFPIRKRGIEGYPNSPWILLDYFGVVIHIFLREDRDYYNLEKLWGNARVELLPA